MKRIIFFLIAIFLLACDEEDKIVITNLITVTIDQSYITSSTDDWIVVHDEAGNSVDFKPFETSDVITFETESKVAGTMVGVTLIKSYGQQVKSYTTNTYLNLNLGGELTVEATPYNSQSIGSKIGTFSVNLTSTNYMNNYTISSKLGGGCMVTGSGLSVNYNCDLYDQATKYMLQATDYTGNLRYKFIDGVIPNSSYNIAFGDMANFDKVVKFNYSAPSSLLLFVEGREPGLSIHDNGYTGFQFSSYQPNQISAGYLNALTNYFTLLNLTYPTYEYFYSSFGTIPTGDLTFSSPGAFTILSKSVENFSSSVGSAFVYRSSEFRNKDQSDPSRWTVHSTSSGHVLMTLPDEIAAGIPGLQITNYMHNYTYYYIQSPPYLESIFRSSGETYVLSGVTIR